jgi:ubiquinone/menaquinone biosynthesis C-methylase UbiE
MQDRKGTASPLVDEGAAFDRLEGLLFARGKEHSMHATRVKQDGAPVEAWDAIASGYDEYVAPGEAELAAAALRLVGLAPGQRFLDVAAGPGGLSLPAARLGARVVATDWSPKMIERLEARARHERLHGVEGRVMECHDLELDDASFDVVGSAFGVMLVADQPRALAEMVRVTKPGGRVLVIAYGPPSEFEALHVFIAGLRVVKPGFELPSEPPPLEFQVSDSAVLRQRLVDAGLRDVVVDTGHSERIALRSGRDLWNWCLGGNPIPGMLVAGLSDAEREVMCAKLDELIRARATAQGVAILTAPLNIGIGTK